MPEILLEFPKFNNGSAKMPGDKDKEQPSAAKMAKTDLFDMGERLLLVAVKRLQRKYNLPDKDIPALRILKLSADALRTLETIPLGKTRIKMLVVEIITSQPPHDHGPTRIFYMTELQPKVIPILVTALQTLDTPFTTKQLFDFLLIEPRLLPLIRGALEDAIPNLIIRLVNHMIANEKTMGYNLFKEASSIVKLSPDIHTTVIKTLQKHYSEHPLTDEEKQELHGLLTSDETIIPFVEEIFGKGIIQELSQFTKSKLACA